MTNVYQKYSSKKRRRGIELSKNFVIKKIDEYKEKSFKTLRAAQDFSIDQDLTMFNYQSKSDNFSFLGKDLISMGITEPIGMRDGYYTVDYNKIDVDMEVI